MNAAPLSNLKSVINSGNGGPIPVSTYIGMPKGERRDATHRGLVALLL